MVGAGRPYTVSPLESYSVLLSSKARDGINARRGSNRCATLRVSGRASHGSQDPSEELEEIKDFGDDSDEDDCENEDQVGQRRVFC